MSEPQTPAGKALLRRGSNNWTGSDWQLTFAANIAKAEAEARDAALAEERERVWVGLERLVLPLVPGMRSEIHKLVHPEMGDV